jgi:1-phosphofructokinase family hexose kinase
VPGFHLGVIHRPERLINLAGGKGLNVARVIRQLGGDSSVCLLLGGHSGAWFADELRREGIPADIAWSQGETRTCTSILDPETRTVTEIYEAGSGIKPEEWADFESLAGKALGHVAIATLSGSLPAGAPLDGYSRLIEQAHNRKIPVVLDTHGEPLRAALAAGPYMVKVNAREAAEITGREAIRTPGDAARATRMLREGGIAVAVITLGRAGAVAAGDQGTWFAAPPPVPALSAVGSGDALLAGLILALQNGEPLAEALRLGVAVGAANTLVPGAGLFDNETVTGLLPRVTVERHF